MEMISRIAVTVLLASLLLAAGCATIAGVGEEPQEQPPYPTAPYDRYVEGRPSLDPRTNGGFYIWREGNLWHVRVAEKFNRPQLPTPVWPVITGVISVENGFVADVRKVNVPPLDFVRFRQDEITYRFELREGSIGQVMGFDFQIRPTLIDYCVTLEVLVDGVPRPGIVHLGTFMHNPETLPFRICLRSFGR